MPLRAAEELPQQQCGFNQPQEPSPSPSATSAPRVVKSRGSLWTEPQWAMLRNVIELAQDS